MSNFDEEYKPGRVEVWAEILMQLKEVAELHLLHCSKERVEVKHPQPLNEGQSFQKPPFFPKYPVSDSTTSFTTGVNPAGASKTQRI